MKKNWLCLCFAGIMAGMLLAGCGKSVPADEAAAGAGSTVVSSEAKTGTSSGQQPEGQADGQNGKEEMLFESLVNITPEGYEPCLAESWEISEDGKVYTFKIRPEVYFSDGEVCDANAIKTNFDAIIENKERHTWLEMMQLLVSVEAPDQDTLVITMSAPYYPMLTELGVTRPFAMISPGAIKNGSTKDGVEAYIGPLPIDRFCDRRICDF